MGLVLVKQGDGESLQDYVKNFHVVTLNMKNLKNQWVIDAFIMGVQNNHVKYSFTNNRPQSLTYLFKPTSSQKWRKSKGHLVAPFRGRIDSPGIGKDLVVDRTLLTNSCE